LISYAINKTTGVRFQCRKVSIEFHHTGRGWGSGLCHRYRWKNI